MFDPNRAEYVLSFLEMLPFGSGDFAGKPFRLQQWQKDPLQEFYGTLDEDEETGEVYRHYQYLYEEIPKKNGKTEVAAGLGLYHLVGDGEQNPQVYICAADKENASICYNAMCAMVDARPWLQKRVYQVPSRKEIRLADDSGFIKVLSSEAYSKHTILEASRAYKLVCLGVDPYLSRMMSGRLEKAKLTVVEIRQNMTDMSPAMKDVEIKLRGGEMVHEHNTCARWNFGNTRCTTDGNANIKPMKNLSTGRIDITVAWIISHATAMLAPANSLAERVQSGQWRM